MGHTHASQTKTSSRMVRRSRRKASQSGFTLIEIMLTLAVAVGMTVLALSVGAKAMDSAKLNQARDLATAMGAQLDTRFAMFPNYGMLPTTHASDWVTGFSMNGSNVAGPWGKVQLQAATINTTNDAWALTFNDVPPDMCTKMLATMSPNYYSSGANATYSDGGLHVGVDPDAASTQCNKVLNTVSFIAPPSITAYGTPTTASTNPPAASTLPAWDPAIGAPAPTQSIGSTAPATATTPSTATSSVYSASSPKPSITANEY